MTQESRAEMLSRKIADVSISAGRALVRFALRNGTWNNYSRDVRKLGGIPVCGDTLAEIRKWEKR